MATGEHSPAAAAPYVAEAHTAHGEQAEEDRWEEGGRSWGALVHGRDDVWHGPWGGRLHATPRWQAVVGAQTKQVELECQDHVSRQRQQSMTFGRDSRAVHGQDEDRTDASPEVLGETLDADRQASSAGTAS